MKKIKYIFLFLIIFGICFSGQTLFAYGEADLRYSQAIRYIKKKQADFAFMDFRSIVRDFPKTSLAQRSRFAIAEYYYDHRMHSCAIDSFTAYIKDYPSSKANVFARAYLLKIIEEIPFPTVEEKKMFEDIKKEIFSKPLFLLFKEYKETSYRSPSLNRFKMRYYLDNVEVYRNGQLFIKISQ